ncbi:MAG TPA: type II secretion system F family protein [Burkholderiales bacterium]
MRFNVLAVDARQQVVALNLEAASESLAADELRQRGLTPLSLKANGLVLSFKRKAKFNTALFSVELSSLLRAGLNLVEALQTLADKDAQGERREVLSGLLAAIHRGEPFSQAVAGYPRQFPPLYVATVKSAERTGSLREALDRYIAYQEELERVKKKVISATIYPAILLAVGALVIGFLVLYVVPRFAQVYADMSATLPFFSRLLLGFGNVVGAYQWLIAIVIPCVVALAFWAFRQQKARAYINLRIWRVPAVGERMKTYQLARLYRTTGMLLDAGIPVVRALEMTRGLLAAHLRPQLLHAQQQIEKGVRLSAALAAAGLATPVAARMMAVGERGGEMGRMFAEIARFHDDEVARFIDVFTRAFEPVLMTVLGAAVGLVVVLMYMPIFELAGSVR